MKNKIKLFWFTTFHTRLWLALNLLRLILVKIDEFIKVCDGTRYLALFRAAKFIGVKSGITYVFSHNYAKIKVDLFDSLPLEKTFAFRNVIIHIKSVLNKDQNHYYHNTFLEKCSCQLAKNSDTK